MKVAQVCIGADLLPQWKCLLHQPPQTGVVNHWFPPKLRHGHERVHFRVPAPC